MWDWDPSSNKTHSYNVEVFTALASIPIQWKKCICLNEEIYCRFGFRYSGDKLQFSMVPVLSQSNKGRTC